MKYFLSALCILAVTGVNAQSKGKAKGKTPAQEPTKTAPATDGFIRMSSGLEFKLLHDAPGAKATIGDHIEVNITTSIGDSVIFDSKSMNGNKPVPYQISAPQFAGDIPEGLTMMSPGDSAIFKVPVDSIPPNPQEPGWIKRGVGQKFVYRVQMVSAKSQAEMEKEKAAAGAAQAGIDEKILTDYFTKNKIKATKTASGLYYVITKEGTGANAAAGKKVSVNYTGKTLDGKPFDSNIDPQFQHVQPFEFALGQGQVIKGWDEGIQLLKKGGKGTLYIPSYLAYGERSPTPAIPANGILMFDVEVTDIKD